MTKKELLELKRKIDEIKDSLLEELESPLERKEIQNSFTQLNFSLFKVFGKEKK